MGQTWEDLIWEDPTWEDPTWVDPTWVDPTWVDPTWGDLIWAGPTWADPIWVGPIWVAPRNKFQCHIPALSHHRVGVQVLQCGTQALAAIQVAILEVTQAVTLFTMATFRWEVAHHTLTRQCSLLP